MIDSVSQNPPSHFDDGMSGRDLFWTDFHAIKNGLATPHPLLVIYRLQNLFIPLVPWINQKTISLGQHGRP